jgi:hypothetical protein
VTDNQPVFLSKLSVTLIDRALTTKPPFLWRNRDLCSWSGHHVHCLWRPSLGVAQLSYVLQADSQRSLTHGVIRRPFFWQKPVAFFKTRVIKNENDSSHIQQINNNTCKQHSYLCFRKSKFFNLVIQKLGGALCVEY